MSKDVIVIEESQIKTLDTSIEKYEQIESDLNSIQTTMNDIADKLATKLSNLMEFADSAQNDKMYTALAKVVSAFSQLNKDTAEIIKQKQQLYDGFKSKPQTETGGDVINNDNRAIHFNGTSAELLENILSKKS